MPRSLMLGLVCFAACSLPDPAAWLGSVDDAPKRGGATAASGNILIVLADDVGAEKLKAYGLVSKAPTTPKLDALAKRGVSFDYAYTNPTCSPTRASLLTGRHPHQHGIGLAVSPQRNFELEPSEQTLPEMLDENLPGVYSHAYVGKWHLERDKKDALTSPIKHGFGSWAGTLGNLHQPYALDGGEQHHEDWEELTPEGSKRKTQWATSRQVDVAIQKMKELPEPWLIVVGLSSGHDPFQAPPKDLISGKGFGENKRTKWFNEMIEAMDTDVGRLVDAAPKEHTTVLFLADNGTPGEVSGELDPKRVKKTVYEGGVRVPFIVAGPAVKKPGRRVKSPVLVQDIFATVADLSGHPLTEAQRKRTDSQSVVPMLQSPKATGRKYAYSERLTPLGHGPWKGGAQMIRDTEYKLIRNLGGRDELYDMRGVEFEGKNLLSGTLSASEKKAYDRLKAALPKI